MARRYYWLKLKDDYLESPKIKKLRKIAGGDTYTIIYLKMQLLSVKTQGAIEYEGIEPSFAEELALKLNEDIDNVKITLSYLESQGLIEASEESTYLLPEVLKSIGSETESASRMRALRTKKASLCDSSVTSCDTDIDIDIDIDRDMLYQYQCMSAQFEAEGFSASVETERSGGKKNPVLVCLENLRKDIGSYSDRLKLNAKAYETETIPDKKEKSVFAKLLDENRQDDAS